MSVIKLILVVFVSFCFSQAKPYLPSKKEKRLVEQIIIAQNIPKAVSLGLKRLVQNKDKANPGVISGFLPEFYKKIDEKVILAKISKSWYGEYSVSELKGILRFFKSKAGKKYLAKNSEISMEMQKLGSVYAIELYKELNSVFPKLFPLDAKTIKMFNMLGNK